MKVGDDLASDLNRVFVVFSQVIGHARSPAVDVASSEFFGGHDLPRLRL